MRAGQPDIRQAANTAMVAIDDMLSGLHRLRQRMVTEIRQADDATAAGRFSRSEGNCYHGRERAGLRPGQQQLTSPLAAA